MSCVYALTEKPVIDLRSKAAACEPDAVSIPRLDTFLASVEKRAWSIARLSTRDDDASLDIVQDAMMRMFEHYADRPEEQWPVLFYRILNNRVTDHHRKRGWRRLQQWFGEQSLHHEEGGAEAVDQLPDQSPLPDTLSDSRVIGRELRRALDELPERQRQAFVYRQWLGMSVSETATVMDVSEGSVKTHLSRAMSGLRNKLEALRP